MLLLAVLAWTVVAQTCNAPTPGDRRTDKTVVRVGNFNLAWLFDGVSDPAGSPWTGTTALQHIQKVSEQILRTGVDVLAVHEVEQCGVLSALLAFLGPAYEFFLIPGTDTGTRQNSALITKIDPLIPLARTEARVSFPVPGSSCGTATAGDSGVSKHAITTIAASNFTFDLVFAHFKSGSTSDDCVQREAQAAVLANNALRPGVATVLCGDFNDWDSTFVDAAGNVGSSKTLSTLKGSRFVNTGQRVPLANRSSSGVGLIGAFFFFFLVVWLNSLVRPRATDGGAGCARAERVRGRQRLSLHLLCAPLRFLQRSPSCHCDARGHGECEGPGRAAVAAAAAGGGSSDSRVN